VTLILEFHYMTCICANLYESIILYDMSVIVIIWHW